LTVYDIIITFSQEIDVIWSRKWTAMTWLFACARYGGFLMMWCSTLYFMGHDRCVYGLIICGRLVFSALRVYALSRRSLWPAGLVFALGMVPIGTAAVSDREFFIAADMLVLFVTWHRTCKTYKLARESNIKTSFSTLLIRDGAGFLMLDRGSSITH
ncbi:hypothetical protein BDW22DRAFT_1334252, partial [Trametopsis cervina]